MKTIAALAVSHERSICRLIQRVAAIDLVTAQLPQVSHLAHLNSDCRLGHRIGRIFFALRRGSEVLNHDVDLAHLKASCLQAEIQLNL